MDIFFVYHKIKPDFWKEPDVIRVSDYEYVATVVTSSLEGVFILTNNIDRDWQKNEGIVKTAPRGKGKGFRSTSVGDVIIGYAYNEMNTNVNLVCGCGFKTVGIIYDETTSEEEDFDLKRRRAETQ